MCVDCVDPNDNVDDNNNNDAIKKLYCTDVIMENIIINYRTRQNA